MSKPKAKSKSKNPKRDNIINLVLSIFSILISASFAIYLIMSAIIPTKYLLLGIILLSVYNLIIVGLLLTNHKRWKRIVAIILIVISTLAMAYGAKTLYSVDSFIKNITKGNKNEKVYSLLVLEGDSYETGDQVEDTPVGYAKGTDLTTAVNLMPKNAGALAMEYASYPDLANALYDKEERLIILDESFRTIVKMSHPNFFWDTKIIACTDTEYLAKLKEREEAAGPGQSALPTLPDDFLNQPLLPDDVKDPSEFVPGDDTYYYAGQKVDGTKPFTCFISGMDTYGDIDIASNSDVNIICAVNPSTHEVLLMPVPRDSYVPIYGTEGGYDKLTHAGVLGVEASANSVADLMGIHMDSYLKVNFSTLIQGVDLLGGITVDNPVEFTSVQGYHFAQGPIRLNGEQALAFSRERKNLSGGDFDRGMNQTRVIKGMINEGLKPNNLLNADKLLNKMSGGFKTNMPDVAIRNLIADQIDSMAKWDIQASHLKGYGQMGLPSYFLPNYNLSFVVLYEDSVEEGRDMLLDVLEVEH